MKEFGNVYNGIRFSNLAELTGHIGKLDKAEMKEVHIPDKGRAESYHAVWNSTKNILEAVTIKPNVINHENILRTFMKSCETQGLEMNGVISNMGGLVEITALFPGMKTGIKGDDYQLGIRLKNDYSKQRFSAEAFGFREMCGNGNIFGDLVAGITIPHFTKKTADIEKELLYVLQKTMDSGERLTELFKEASEEDLGVEELKEVVLGETRRKKRADRIVEYALKNDRLTRYTVFNAITQYATFDAINANETEMLQKKAMRILVTPKKDLNRTEWKKTVVGEDEE